MLVEQVIAITLIAVTLLGLLTVLGAGSRAVVNGRQRVVATSLGRQALERLQGGAYSSVAMDLSSPGLSSDPRVTGTAPALAFEGEPLVGGSAAPYQAQETVAGASYTISTFITAVVPSQGLPYRRATVFVEWTPSLSGSRHSQRFSTLVYPLDYESYPVGSGLAEVTGGRVTVTGYLGADTFEEAWVALPAVRAKTSASTLARAQGTASSATGVVDVTLGPLTGTGCTVTGAPVHTAQCPVSTVDEVADNDSGTSTPAWSTASGAVLHGGASVTTPGGTAWSLPADSGEAHASVQACGGCGYGDGDGVVWADSTRTTSGEARASFSSTTGLAGRLWEVAAGWSASATVDHDTSGGRRVTSTGQLNAPPAKVFALDGAGAFDAAVLVGDSTGFTASANASAGDGTAGPSATSTSVPVKLWDGAVGGYRTVTVTPGASTDEVATASLAVNGHTVSISSRVQSTPSTSTSTGSAPRTEANSQHPSLLLVTVQADVWDSSGTPVGSVVVSFDYGQVTARSGWAVSP